MWFKNLQLFKFTQPTEYKPEKLAERLEDFCFQPCSKIMAQSYGWVPPIGDEEAPLVHAANGFMLIGVRIEDKILPAGVIREQLAERVSKIEEKEDRKMGRKEKLNIKDDVTHDLLTRAFTKSSYLYAIIDTTTGWLIVNTPSITKAEFFTTFLRKSLTQLHITIPDDIEPPVSVMTKWLANNSTPANFVIGESCLLENVKDESATVRCTKQDLFDENVQGFLNEGYTVKELAFQWTDRVSFNLTDEFSIKKINYLDIIQDMAREIHVESEAQRFDADFTIMTETLRALMHDLTQAFKLQQGSKSKGQTKQLVADEAEAEIV